MKYEVDYKEVKDLKILFRTFRGVVSMADIISSWKYAINNKLITSFHKGVISDFSSADLQIDKDDIFKLEDFYNKNMNLFEKLKVAQIVDSPKIIFPMLFQNEFPNFKSKPFSTVMAAKKWIVNHSK